MALTPMMQKYLETKEQYKDCIVFYRLGDFYEMFFDDAVTASKILDIALTGKSCGLEERAPMCGVPYHSVDGYLNKLVKSGHKVAIVEQVEDPALAKGLVKREVVRIVTPGTNLDTASMDETKNNYLMCVFCMDGGCGISAIDITTGDYCVTEAGTLREMTDEIYKFAPSEIICNDAFMVCGVNTDELKNRLQIAIYPLENSYFDGDGCKEALIGHFGEAYISSLGVYDYPCGTVAAGALMKYLTETQKNSLEHLTRIDVYSIGKFMVLDTAARRNLELCETLREKQRRGSLLWVLDKTKTAMGARMLRSFIEQPLIDRDAITRRQAAIAELNDHLIARDELREYLSPVYDLERLIGKIAYRSANPRDLIAFKRSLSMLPHIKNVLADFSSDLFVSISESLDPLDDLFELIENAIEDDPPLGVKDGGIIKSGFSEQIDGLRAAKTEGKSWLASLEAKERDSTGIKNLRIKYNRVFGYYIEVTNSYKDLVPDTYIRRQTLANAERYTTDELKQLEERILGAEERLFSLEYNLFSEIREKIAGEISRIQKTAKAVAAVDVFASLSYVAEKNNYTRPEINEDGVINIKDGRHPVVEKMMADHMFIPNDTYLDTNRNLISIITGPNMAGKSTYMRQTALIVLMAQIGSYVPAASADICICDKIFTRVGASDDLAGGQSTFMVEMTEVANILKNATSKSLLILDEIGRGTSTFDGLAIAWAVIEYISDHNLLGAKTLFATHYHELTELEGALYGVNNYCISVREQGDDIVFLRKIVAGGADQSYGIQVAKLAGVPDTVLNRAKELVAMLCSADIASRAKEIAKNLKPAESILPEIENDMELTQISLFDTVKERDITDEIESLNLGKMTPIDALNELYKLQNMLKNRWSG